jgi:hypothetical protein
MLNSARAYGAILDIFTCKMTTNIIYGIMENVYLLKNLGLGPVS